MDVAVIFLETRVALGMTEYPTSANPGVLSPDTLPSASVRLMNPEENEGCKTKRSGSEPYDSILAETDSITPFQAGFMINMFDLLTTTFVRFVFARNDPSQVTFCGK